MSARAMDASQWSAVVEMCDEIAARIPEADPDSTAATSHLNALRSTAVHARAFARLGTGLASGSPSGEPTR